MSAMYASVDAEQFYEALSRVYRMAAKRNSLPILGGALACFDGRCCTITCTNLNQWCRAMIPAEGDCFSVALVKAKSVLNVCRHASGKLEFSYTPDPNRAPIEERGTLTVNDGVRSLQCRTDCALDFPQLPKIDYWDRYPINAEHLLERFNRVKYAVSSDTNRPARCCIEFIDSRIVTLDGYRLALSADTELTVKQPFFIPVEVMAELQMFKGLPCALCVGERYAAFESESLLLLTRTPENDLLNVDRVIPTAFESEYTVPVEPLWEEIRYLNTVAIKKERRPICFDGETMLLETSDGIYTSKVGLPPVSKRGFHPRYLLEGLGQFKAKKAGTITMKVNHPHAPIILTDNESDLAMVFPVRLGAA